jgi:hypothetical protein
MKSVSEFYEYIKNLKQTTWKEYLLAQTWELIEDESFRGGLCKLLNKYKQFPLIKTIFNCPKCSKALYSPKGIICPSLPPQIELRCFNCNHKDYEFINMEKYETYFLNDDF